MSASHASSSAAHISSVTRAFNMWWMLHLSPSDTSLPLPSPRLQRPGSSPGRLMEDALVCRGLVQFLPVERPWNPGGDLWNDQTLPMSGCWAGSRHKKEADVNAGRKKRKTGDKSLDAGWRCSYSVIYHCFKIMSLFFLFCKSKSVKTKNDRTGTVKKKERCTVELHVRDFCCRFHPVIGVWRWHHRAAAQMNHVTTSGITCSLVAFIRWHSEGQLSIYQCSSVNEVSLRPTSFYFPFTHSHCCWQTLSFHIVCVCVCVRRTRLHWKMTHQTC